MKTAVVGETAAMSRLPEDVRDIMAVREQTGNCSGEMRPRFPPHRHQARRALWRAVLPIADPHAPPPPKISRLTHRGGRLLSINRQAAGIRPQHFQSHRLRFEFGQSLLDPGVRGMPLEIEKEHIARLGTPDRE